MVQRGRRYLPSGLRSAFDWCGSVGNGLRQSLKALIEYELETADVAAIHALRVRPVGIVSNLCLAGRTRPPRRGKRSPRPWKNGLRDNASRSGPRPSSAQTACAG